MVRGRGADVCSTEKNQIAQFLLANSSNGVVHHGKLQEAITRYGASNSSIYRIWTAAKAQILQGIPVHLTSNKVGIPKSNKIVYDLQKIREIPLHKRSIIRRLSNELDTSKITIGRWLKSEVIRAHTNSIKPKLTETNKLSRLNFCLNNLIFQPESKTVNFSEMFQVVHIDEKWFYMSKETERYYMLSEEVEPHRTCKSKKFIPKIMFMCAVTRPRSSVQGTLEFDGKIEIWPFTKRVAAERNSKNRLKGTMVTKPIDSITNEVIKGCLIHQIIPAIREKWPANACKNIIIQQDNAKPHINNDDADFRAAATSDGFNIKLMCQPPNSPDTNVNDLGWFRALQSIKDNTRSYNVDELVANVLLSFQNLSASSLNNVFLSLRACMIEIMKSLGQNNYKIPHMGKERLIRGGNLPMTLQADLETVKRSIAHLLASGPKAGLTYDIEDLLATLEHN